MVKLEITKKIIMRLFWVVVLFLGMLYIAASRHISLGMPYQKILFNDKHICSVAGDIDVRQIEKEVRRELALASEDKLPIDYRMEINQVQEFFEPLMTENELEAVLREQLTAAIVNDGLKSYTLEIEGYEATFASLEEVKKLFDGVKAAVDEKSAFAPVIKMQDGHVKGMLTASLEPVKPNVWESDIIPEEKIGDGISAGVTASLMNSLEYEDSNGE